MNRMIAITISPGAVTAAARLIAPWLWRSRRRRRHRRARGRTSEAARRRGAATRGTHRRTHRCSDTREREERSGSEPDRPVGPSSCLLVPHGAPRERSEARTISRQSRLSRAIGGRAQRPPVGLSTQPIRCFDSYDRQRETGPHRSRRGGSGSSSRQAALNRRVPLPQPRALVARLQRAHPRLAEDESRAAARAGEVPRHLQPQSRRVLPDPGLGPAGADDRRRVRHVAGRDEPARAARRDPRPRPGARRRGRRRSSSRSPSAAPGRGVQIADWDDLKKSEREELRRGLRGARLSRC